ncbi:MAG TPA: Gfo/Idh/MocA family oxidoreductase [Pirellulaceae bacterium]|jgi:predicted dehydrogenase|nr:Gfo/Idh/MocA family oxidoreductase [Pirellulaceae bacterium]
MIRCFALSLFALATLAFGSAMPALAQEDAIKIGVIGLDTSHSPAFARAMNERAVEAGKRPVRVVAAYPYGSSQIESSASRIPKFTEDFKAMGIEIVDSIDALLAKVDGVLLETNDGTLRKEQFAKILAAKKPVFADKPAAATWEDTLWIYRQAEAAGLPIFSASSLRYQPTAEDLSPDTVGEIVGADSYSPCSMEPHHSRLYWYGIHGVETLFTIMGPGCESVSCTATDGTDLAVGRWAGDRIGTFRGIRKGKADYGGTIYGTKAIRTLGKYPGYAPLVVAIEDFFRTGKSPVSNQETLEIYAFMEAARLSAERGGAPVSIAELFAIDVAK